ncbi:MAG: putative metal-binding motif-containing protein [Myxococcota bacterium]
MIDGDALVGPPEYDPDDDGDGFLPPEDCDDHDPAVNPSAEEVCATAADDDCSGTTNDDDARGCEPFYGDGDGDGAGELNDTRCLCEPDGAWSAAAGDDCDDDDATVGAPSAWYRDGDADGYGAGEPTAACEAPEGLVGDASDCDDDDPDVHPGAAEVCDGVDADCDGTTDDEAGLAAFWDGVAWTDVTASVAGASPEAPASYALPSLGTLRLCDGTFHARLVATSDNVTIESANGAEATTLEATGSVLTVTDGSVLVRGLTITGGTGTGSTTTYGGGVLAASVSALPLTTANLTLDTCVVTGNAATRGGGVAVYTTAYVRLVDTAVYGNAATLGGGAWVDEGTLTCEGDATVAAGLWANTASSAGGGAWLAADASLNSFTCDWGDGADDNAPDDVSEEGAAAFFEADATFAY